MLISNSKYDTELKLAFAKELADAPLAKMLEVINSNLLPIVVRFNDLQYWTPLLNKFDELLEFEILKYELSETRTKLLEVHSDDEYLIVSVLKFTDILLNYCTTKPIYNSTDRLYDLLNTCNISIRYHSLRIITLIANRLVKKRFIKFTVPSIIKKKVSYLANSFPPELPITNAKDIDMSYDLYDILVNEKPIPAGWAQLDFKYFRSSSSEKLKPKAKTVKPPESKEKKTGKKKSQKNLASVEGVSHFVLSQEELRKLSFQQIYDKATSIIPSEYWFKFGVQLTVAKSFSNKSYECLMLRDQLVKLKVIATACNLLINDSTSIADEQLLSESDTNNISSLIALVNPENQVKIDTSIYSDAMLALSCISSKKHLRSELLKLLNGNVSHGLFFKILRSIHKTLKENNTTISVQELSLQDNKFEDTRKAYIWFLSMLDNLTEVKSLSNSLVSAGLLNILIDFLPLRSNRYKNMIAYAVSILKSLISSNLNNLDPFISKNGFQLLIDAVGDQVDYVIANLNIFTGLEFMDEKTKNFNVKTLDHNDLTAKVLMKEREFGYVKSLIRFAFELIRTDSGDRMRNLFDSPLLKSFNKILVHGKLFEAKILTNTLSTITLIIHNEPTSFPILLESETIDTVIDHFSEFIMDNGYLILSLPEIIGAICLNKAGLQKIKENKVVTKMFLVFTDVKISKVLVNDEVSAAVATGFDELGRHYADLKPEIVKATGDLIEKMPDYVGSRMKGVTFYKSSKNKSLYYNENEELAYTEDGCSTIIDDIEEDLYMLENAANFIYTGFTESDVWYEFFEKVKNGTHDFLKWLPFLLYEKAPYDHINSSFYFSIVTTIKALEELNKGYGFDVLFKKVHELLKDPLILDFIDYTNKDGMTYFTKFDAPDAEGSTFMRKLNQVSIGINALVEIYMHAEGVHPARVPFISKHFATDEGLEIVSLMMRLFQRIAVEEILIRDSLPKQVAQISLPSNQSIYSPQLVVKSELYNREMSLKIEKTSAKIKNTVQIRCIMEDIQSSVGCCLAVLPKLHVIFNRLANDKDSVEHLKNAIRYNQHLAQIFSNTMFNTEKIATVLLPLQTRNYVLVILHLFEHVLCRKTAGLSSSQTPFGVYFMQYDGFIVLRNLLLAIVKDVAALPSYNHVAFEDAMGDGYVEQNNYCITMAILQRGYSVFARVCTKEFNQEFPFTYHFAHWKWGAVGIMGPFLVQARIAGLGLLALTLHSICDSAQSLPTDLLRHVLTLTTKIFTCEGEAGLQTNSILYPLTEDTLDGPAAVLTYLMGVGLSETQAKRFVKETKCHDGKLEGAAPSYIDADTWETSKKRAQAAPFTPVDIQPVNCQWHDERGVDGLNALRREWEQFVFNNWSGITRRCVFLIDNVALLVRDINRTSFGEKSKCWAKPMQMPRHLMDDDVSVALRLMAALLDKPLVWEHQDDISYAIACVQNFVSSDHSTDAPWFANCLAVYEKLVASRLVPSRSEACVHIDIETWEHFPEERQYKVPQLVDHKVLGAILKLESFTDLELASTVAKILIVHLQSPDSGRDIISSDIILKLLRTVEIHETAGNAAELLQESTLVSHKKSKEVAAENERKLADYKLVLTALIRRCFETQDVIRKLVNNLVEQSIKSSSKPDRLAGAKSSSLFGLVKSNSHCVLRDPATFIDAVSQRAVLSSPQDPVRSLHIYKYETKKSEEAASKNDDATSHNNNDDASSKNDDITMVDASRTDVPTGIMRVLLTELMRIKTNDWVDDSPEQKLVFDQIKKNPNKSIKADDREKAFRNPKHSYVRYLLVVVVELLASYKQSKLEFLTFSKKSLAPGSAVKPRSTALNFFLHQLIPTGVFVESAYNENSRRLAVSRLAKYAIFALLSTVETDVQTEHTAPHSAPKEDPDMLFIRKFAIDIIARAIKESCESKDVADVRYSKIVTLGELCSSLLYPDLGFKPPTIFAKNSSTNDTFFISKAMVERSIPSQMAAILTSIDLNFPGVKKVAKTVIKLLNIIGSLKSNHQSLFKSCSDGEEEEEVDAEDYDSHEEIAHLFRNSSLGMYDVDSINSEDDSDEYDEDSDDSDIVVYSDDELDAPGEYESDHGSVMEIDVDLADDPQDDVYDDNPDQSSEDVDDYDEDVDDEVDVEDDEDAEIVHDDESDSSFLSEEDVDEEVYNSDESEVIDQWLEDYDRDAARNTRNRSSHANSSTEMSILQFIDRFSHDFIHDRRFTRSPRQSEDPFDEEDQDEEDPEEDGSETDTHEDAFVRSVPGNRGLQSVVSGTNRNENGVLVGDWSVRGLSNHSLNARLNGFVPPRFTVLERLLSDKIPTRRYERDTRGEFRSTLETWSDIYEMFFGREAGDAALNIIPAIVDRIYDVSKQVNSKKLEEKRKKEKELEEKVRAKEQERQKKYLEERRIRQEEEEAAAAAAASTSGQEGEEGAEAPEPVMVQIGDREVDIAGTGIDLEFLLALPMDMREEVFVQHMSNTRESRREEEPTNGIDPDFLDALPEQIRHEIVAQQAMASTLHSSRNNMFHHMALDEDEEESHGEDEEAEEVEDHTEEEKDVSKKKIYFTPLVDKAGVAGILRLVFVKQKSSYRVHFFDLLEYLCYSKQTRTETVSILLYILQEGINDQKSLEKTFTRISNRALAKSASSGSTSLSTASLTVPQNKNNISQQFPINASPVDVAIRILGALNHLLENYPHLRYYFLSEHESSIAIRKLTRSRSRSKELSSRETKYPINILLSLVDKPLVKKEHILMDLLSKAIKIATSSLAVIEKAKERESKEKESKEKESKEKESKEKDLKEKEKNKNDQEKNEKNNVSGVSKPTKLFEPPVIPNPSLSLVVSTLIAGDCSSKTFQQALTTMRNLSFLSNAKHIFSTELSSYATTIGRSLVADLKELAEVIKLAGESSDLGSDILNKFTTSSSTQNKLLRVLTALDYLFDKEGNDVESLKSLYEKIALGPLWGTLSDCLRGLEQNKSLYHIATVLLPLIESLMVVCKHSKVRDLQIKDTLKYESKAHDFTNEPIESLFFSFTSEHKTILNEMVRKKPKLMSGPFAMLVRNPKVLEFDNKRNYFDRKIHSKAVTGKLMAINVSRDRVFLDSYRACAFKSPEEFRDAKLDISFKGEAGIDAGGVTREWYQVLSRQIFNPDYALFVPVASDKSTFHPNRTSWVNSEHLLFFRFIGRVIGKAIYDNQYLDAHFSRAVYKRLLGRPVSLKDMETLDLDYFKSLIWMLENDITDIITETFSVETDDYGEVKVVDLKPDGRNIPVTEENKQEYVKLVVEYRLQESVKEQMENFLFGFHEIIPKDLIAIFDEQELELLISGLPDIDVDDWKNNSVYTNYSPSSPAIQWFWRAVKSFDNEQKAKLLQFVTGTSKVPLQGFSALAGVNGNHKFSIHRDYGSLERLPSAHTCFNQLDLPPYESYEQLRGSLLLAITEGHEGFGFA